MGKLSGLKTLFKKPGVQEVVADAAGAAAIEGGPEASLLARSGTKSVLDKLNAHSSQPQQSAPQPQSTGVTQKNLVQNAFTNPGAFLNQGMADAKKAGKNILFWGGAILFIIGIPIYLLWNGYLPLSAWYTWTYIACMVIAISGLWGFKKTSKSGDVSIGMHPLRFLFFLALGTIIVLSFSNIFDVGPLAQGKQQLLDTVGLQDVKLSNLYDLFSLAKQEIHCQYASITDPANPLPECQPKTLVNPTKNIQEVKTDIKVDSFSFEPNVIEAGQSTIGTLTLSNAGTDLEYVNVTMNATIGADTVTFDKNGLAKCDNPDGKTTIMDSGCVIQVSGGSKRSLTSLFTYSGTKTGSLVFQTAITYPFTVTSTLELKTTTDPFVTRSEIPSEATGGSADFIIAAQNQPLLAGDPFQFAFTIKNNNPIGDGSGLVQNAEGKILLPLDIIDKNSLSSSCLTTHNVKIQYADKNTPTTDWKAESGQNCSDYIDNRGNYECVQVSYLNPNSNDNPLNGVKDNEKFFCSLHARSDITFAQTRTVYGDLDYIYSTTKKASVVVQQPANTQPQ